MPVEIINNIPVNLNLGAVCKKLHIKREKDRQTLQTFIDEALPLIEAKALYKVSYIDQKFEDGIKLDGLRLTSTVLRKNLAGVERVFPYVATIGEKLEERSYECSDLLGQFYFDTIGNLALRAVRKYLIDYLRSRYALEGMSTMAPGSLHNWPIEEQKSLFAILGDVQKSIGVALTQHMLMLPKKSASGIIFPTEIPFYSCQLCPRKRCESRKASYNEKLAQEYGLVE